MSTISVDDVVVDETSGQAIFTVRLDIPDVLPVSVNYLTSGLTASILSDFTAVSGTVIFAPGETVKTISVPIVNNATIEELEHFYLLLSSPSANVTIVDSFGIGSVVDNDAAPGVPVVSITDVVVDEAGREATFVVTLDKPSTSVVSMTYATQNGTALAGTDFTAVSGTLTFAPGEMAKTVKVTLLNDTAFEGDESFKLVLSGLTNVTTLDSVGTTIIAENDAVSVSTSFISVDDIVVDETQAFAEFVVRLNAPNFTPVTVSYNQSSLSAKPFGGILELGDYIGLSGALTFAPGETVKMVRIPLLNDTTPEILESFTLNLFNASANAIVINDQAFASIVDNDAVPGMPVVSIGDVVVHEIGKTATFVITLDKPSTSVVSMTYATQNGTALAGTDFTAVSGTLTFAPGEMVKTVTVTLLNDNAFETAEAFHVVLSNLTNATIRDSTGTAIIGESDIASGASSMISVDDVIVDEARGFADFLVRLDAPNLTPVSVNYSTTSLSAVEEWDYFGFSGTLTFVPGEVVRTVRIPILNDAFNEGLDHFALTLSGASVNTTIADGIAMASIVDNDAPTGVPVVRLTDAVVNETDQTVTVTVMLDRPSTGTVSMAVATQDVTATVNSDYRSLTALGTLAFVPGETAKTVTFGLLDDTASERAEIFDVVLSNSVGGNIADGRAHIIISNSDAPPLPGGNITVSHMAAVESDGYLEFIVSLSAPTATPVSVDYATSAGTASAGGLTADYFATSGTITFRPGETSQTIRIGLRDDATVETEEHFVFTLSNAVNGGIYNSSCIATILDNESPLPTAPITIEGTIGDDMFRGTPFADILSGGLGHDVFDGGAGNDTYYGAYGNDVYLLEDIVDSYTEMLNQGTDLVASYLSTHTLGENVENLTLVGSAVTGIGNSLNNTILGNATNNTIDGGLGDDILNGGGGTDTVSYSTATAGVTVSLATTVAQNTVTAGMDTLSNFENLRGSNFNDMLTGNGGSNLIIGGLGDDILNGEVGTDTVSYETSATGVTVSLLLVGVQNTVGAGMDRLSNCENLKGSNYNDILTGDAGSNLLIGGLGNDVLNGDVGTDTVSYETATMRVTVSLLVAGGQNTIGAGTDTLSNCENLKGSNYNDILTGDAGSNLLIGGLGNDVLNGDAGKDTVSYETATTGVTVSLLSTGVQNTVGAGNDTLSNFENILGSDFNDTLTGDAGNNTLTGSFGSDTLSGNSGQDSFVFNTALKATTNKDTITDFSVINDTLVLENAIFTKFTTTGALPAGTFVSGAGAVAVDANDYLIYNTMTGTLSYDVDGNGAGAAVAFVTLLGSPALTAADFTII